MSIEERNVSHRTLENKPLDGFSSSDDFTKPINKTSKMSRTEMLGCMRGQFTMSEDFDAPLDDLKAHMCKENTAYNKNFY